MTPGSADVTPMIVNAIPGFVSNLPGSANASPANVIPLPANVNVLCNTCRTLQANADILCITFRVLCNERKVLPQHSPLVTSIILVSAAILSKLTYWWIQHFYSTTRIRKDFFIYIAHQHNLKDFYSLKKADSSLLRITKHKSLQISGGFTNPNSKSL